MAETRSIKRVLRSLEAIKIQTADFTEDTRISDIKTYLSIIEDEFREFQNLEKFVKGNFDVANLPSVEKIEALYFELKQKLVKFEKLYEENHMDFGHNANQNNTMEGLVLNQTNFLAEVSALNKRESEVRLPRVNIPVFGGKYSEFPSFRDLFEASIHNNNKISKVHKLQYLKGLLKGEAFALINHISVTDAHYDEAWAKVKTRYDKRKHVVHDLLKQFMEQPSLNQNCSKSLRHLADTSDEVIRGLKVLGKDAEIRDPWLIYILTAKLDYESKEAWAHETAEKDFPSLEEFLKFLNKRSDALESLGSIQKPKLNPPKRVSSLLTQSFVPECPLCSDQHYLGRCERYIALAVPERRQLVVEKKLCFNCLASTHQSTVCRSRYNCRICRRRHHITLHPESTANPNKTDQTEEADANNQSQSTACNTVVRLASQIDQNFQAILPTAMVLIQDQFGKLHKCRVLLDSGSQASFISENCVQRLQLQRQRSNITITGIAPGSVVSKGKTVVKLGSLYDTRVQIEVNPLIIKKLPSKIPTFNIEMRDKQAFEGLQLADPGFHKSAAIDILLGSDKFFTILKGEQKVINSRILQSTVFGWVVSGQPSSTENANSSNSMAFNIQIDINIDKTLRQFWEIEETPQTRILSPEDVTCEEIFERTKQRQPDGRYVVQLPFKTNSMKLGNSLKAATQRFITLERKLNMNPKLRDEYVKQMKEYIESGHMTEISLTKSKPNEHELYYLPHHAVFKETSETTKLRIVFDGSSKTSTGISLNEKLMVGPSLQPTLWATLMRFRNHKIAITADIEKMYRQVVVNSKDTDYQRILWRDNSNQLLRHYKLTRVTFGLACSAFLAIRTLQQLARDEGDDNICQHILDDFYVDDFLSGASDIQKAVQLKDDVIRVLERGGFALRKWRSNIKHLSDQVNDSDTTNLCSDDARAILILGLHWHPGTDTLTFKVRPEQEGEITKRKILSESSRVFDPLGFLSPSIILLKILFQKLWFLKIDWDDKLPDCYQAEYKRIICEFKCFDDVKIQRFTNHYGNIQIHGFADASELAYCAVVYSRIIEENGNVSINLLTSKTKVAPIKKISLPRLELCAAYLLVKLMTSVRDILAPTAEYYAWTDSTIVLAWLSTYPAKWKTFVSNRTSQILDKFPRQHWGHVKSADNPADYGTRGLLPTKLVCSTQWWYGPEWLTQPKISWPTRSDSISDETAIGKEMSKSKLGTQTFQASIGEDWLGLIFERKSSLIKIFRVVAYVMRFVSNLANTDKTTGELTAMEIQRARIICIKWVQESEFIDDLNNLRRNKSINNNSKLLPLAPFIDDDNVLRVGGRLFNADVGYDQKHPVIIPANHIFTDRLIWQTHNQNLHTGPTLTNNLIRQEFWIINGRSKIRTIIKNCVTCVKYSHKTTHQLMGNLPAERLTPTRPFTNCGIDFAGPLYFATRKGRGGTKVKGYLCIFVCFSVKAIHIEPVSDMTSESFLAALKRFTARRGLPRKIHTDNGSNFIGAKRILNDACKIIENINNNYIISEFLSSNGIDWHFIPPASPHFGGLWESAVKSVKTHLLKSTNNINLTFEEMATLLCQVENILNSRPLCTTSTDDNYEVLTPAHFLIGTSTGSIPEKEITASDACLSRWQRVQSRIQHFWKKYYRDYLNNLQQRHKWQTKQEDIQVGDIVLIKEDNTPICKWPLGQIAQIHPGNDNLVRVVSVKTASSILQRPIVKLCKLPVC